MSVTAKVAERISTQLKRYQGILDQAKQRDISESNTVVIITDMLSDVLGYDKYQNITTEHAIRGTYVDLAVEMDNEIRFLVEVKAIGLELKDGHVKQAVDYGANKGVEWVVLTNGVVWRIYKIVFAQPIDKTLVAELDVLATSPRDNGLVGCLGTLSKEGFSKDSMAELAQQKLVTSKFFLAQVVLSDTILEQLRREVRRLSPGLKIDTDFLRDMLAREIIKRELIEGDDADSAKNIVKKLQRSVARERERKRSAGDDADGAEEAPSASSDKQEPKIATE